MSIGALDAEHDQRFLEHAFLDTRTLPVLRDTQDRRSIVVGRTGAGKTALLLRLEQTTHRVARIRPEAFSLNYLTNSTILPYLTDLGVHLNLFYKWLWRHAIALEIINTWAGAEPETRRNRFFDAVLNRLPARRTSDKARLIDYRKRWGDHFWQHTDETVRELVENLQTNLKVGLGSDFGLIKGQAEAGRTRETQVRTELVQRTQRIVNETQLHELNAILRVVDEQILDDPHKPYYIVIDDLDKQWVDSEYAYDLTDALIEEIGEFARMTNVKVVIALRDNVVEKLHQHQARARGRQREKHEDMMLRLSWNERELTELANLRVAELIRGEYTGTLTAKDILPSSRKKKEPKTNPMQYILDRTMLRPRDLISFFNHCLKKADESGKGVITWDALTSAELDYSNERLASLEDEWKENFPEIGTLIDAFRSMHDGFRASDLDLDRLMPVISAGEVSDQPDSVTRTVSRLVMEQEVPPQTVAAEFVIPLLYQIGVLGVKQGATHPIQFCYEAPSLVEGRGLWPDATVYFHPAVYRALDVREPRKAK